MFRTDSTCSEHTMFLGSGVLLEKLTVPQLVKKFPAFMELEGASPCPQQPDEPSPRLLLHCNIIVPSMPKSSKCCLSFSLLSQTKSADISPLLTLLHVPVICLLNFVVPTTSVLVVQICTRMKKIVTFERGKPSWDLEKLYAKRQQVQDTPEVIC